MPSPNQDSALLAEPQNQLISHSLDSDVIVLFTMPFFSRKQNTNVTLLSTSVLATVSIWRRTQSNTSKQIKSKDSRIIVGSDYYHSLTKAIFNTKLFDLNIDTDQLLLTEVSSAREIYCILVLTFPRIKCSSYQHYKLFSNDVADDETDQFQSASTMLPTFEGILIFEENYEKLVSIMLLNS